MSGEIEQHQDQELMEDFFNDFREAHQDSENILIDLEHDPQNADLLNALFRSVHTIKGNLVYVGLRDLTPLLQSVEDLLDAIRNHHLNYDSLLSDLILVSMDRTKQMVDTRIHQKRYLYDEDAMNTLCQTISSVAESTPDHRANAIAKALVLLDPSIDLRPQEAAADVNNEPPEEAKTKPTSSTPSIPHDEDAILAHFNITLNDDLNFFKNLASPVENRSLYWQGRTTRQLRLGLAMNEIAGKPIEPIQLAAAIYIHDIGMAFLPLETLHKTSALNMDELQDLHNHPNAAYQLLSAGSRWEQAAAGVMQHHERVDGSGYPNKLQANQICDVAKVLAITDAFEARTHERAYATQLKRPLIRAVLEISRCSESHFDPKWVEVFNEAIRYTHQNKA